MLDAKSEKLLELDVPDTLTVWLGRKVPVVFVKRVRLLKPPVSVALQLKATRPVAVVAKLLGDSRTTRGIFESIVKKRVSVMLTLFAKSLTVTL